MTELEALGIIKNLPLYRYECKLEKDKNSLLYNALSFAVTALEKQIAKKPIFVDIRFRQRGKLYGECVSLEKCYMGPSCTIHLFHDFDSERYCNYCGQKLDWRDEDGSNS